MQDPLSRVQSLRRPCLLLDAARAGLRHYRRETHLSRALGRQGHARLIRPFEALEELLEIEQKLNDERHKNEAGYSYFRHVEVLIATLAEAQTLRATCQPIAAK